MNTIPDPENMLDVLTILAVAVIAAVPSVLAHRNHRLTKEIKDSASLTLAQVKNEHQTNLRDDLDRAIAAINALAVDVRRLRKDLMNEEDHRRIEISDLREDLERRTGKNRR